LPVGRSRFPETTTFERCPDGIGRVEGFEFALDVHSSVFLRAGGRFLKNVHLI
jgi:hypothetical protein